MISTPSRTLVKYYLYSTLSVWQFIAPINVLYMQAQGLSFAAISATLSVFSLGIVVSEIPTGYVGDRIGRRRSLLLGVFLVAGSILVYGLSETVVEFVVVQVVWTAGVGFMSGSSQAWLYDVLEQTSDSDRYAQIRGRASALNAGTSAAAIAAGGYLYSLDQFYPFLAAAVCMTASGIVLTTFPASREESAGSDFELGAVVALLRRILVQSPHRRFVLHTVFLAGGVAVVGGVFVQPMAVSLGLSEQHVGWLFAAATGVGVVVNSLAGRIERRIGAHRWFRLTPLVVATLLAAVLVVPVLVLPVFLAVRGWNNVSEPLRNQYLNDNLADAENRATVISAASMGISLVESSFFLTAGVVSDATSPAVAVGATGLVLTAASLLFLRRTGRTPPNR